MTLHNPASLSDTKCDRHGDEVARRATWHIRQIRNSRVGTAEGTALATCLQLLNGDLLF
jgi:hypothetical protein